MSPRHTGMLAVVALLVAVLAAAAVWWLTPRGGEAEETALVPGFAERAETVRRIRISSGSGSIVLERGDGGWVLPEKAGIRANEERVRALLLGLAELEPVEAKTSNPENFGRIGLLEPGAGEGAGTRFVVEDQAGASVADLIVGERGPGGRARFVRRTGEDQSWLAPVIFETDATLRMWMNRTLLSVPGDRVESVTIDPAEGQAYTLVRDDPEQEDFRVEPLPEGRELRGPGFANPITRALTSLMFEDVRAGPGAPGPVDTVVYQTFEGLIVSLAIGDEERRRWTTITIDAADPENPPEGYEELVERVEGRQFELPGWAAGNMTRALEDLLVPVGEPGAEDAVTPLGPGVPRRPGG